MMMWKVVITLLQLFFFSLGCRAISSNGTCISTCPESASNRTIDHVILLIHGINGHKSNWNNFNTTFLNKRIESRTDTLVVIPDNNAKRLTHSGIEEGSNRIYEYLLQKTCHIQSKVKLTVVGHSLGGLYARYFLSLFSPNDKFIFDTFMTLASPHLGVRQASQQVGLRRLPRWTSKWFSKTLLQLFFRDSYKNVDAAEPIIYRMSQEERFITPLSLFRQRVLYSNIKYDKAVYYSTGAIRRRNPYYDDDGKLTLSKDVLEKYKVFHRSPIVIDEDKYKDYISTERLMKPSTVPFVEDMILALEKLDWRRFAVLPKRNIFAHVDIIAKWMGSGLNPTTADDPVVSHIVDTLLESL